MSLSLKDIYKKYSNPRKNGGCDGFGDKGTCHTYLEIYEMYMGSRRSGISLLELGVFNGMSLAMWSEYFNDSKIVGVDLIKRDLVVEQNGFTVHYCDATDEAALDAVLGEQKFDFIIDDASHIFVDQKKSFDILLKRLNSNGSYFIEDVLCQNVRRIKEINKRFKTFDMRILPNGTRGRSDNVLSVFQF